MIKYFSFKSDKPNKKYCIITNDDQNIYFGQAGYSAFTIHKDEAKKQHIRAIFFSIFTGLGCFSTHT
jgi:hypothetical protein